MIGTRATVTYPTLIDQELVVHVFAPTDGPNAVRAEGEIRQIWQRCHDVLGMTAPIANTHLPSLLPRQLDRSGEPVAACEHPEGEYQAIMRRVQDVMNISVVLAGPSGWARLDRQWRDLAAGGTSGQLGVVTVFQAKHRGDLEANAQVVRAALPPGDEGSYWWRRVQFSPHGFTCWETSPDDERADRRIVVVAPDGQDAELSAWTWSRGDVELPPFARYLMHAAKLRYQARLRGTSQPFAALLDRVSAQVDVLSRPGAGPLDLSGLRAAETKLAASAGTVRAMRRTVEIAVGNMTNVLNQPLTTDRLLGEWLSVQLADDAEYLDTALQTVRDVVASQRESLPPSAISQHRPDRVELRMGFGVDIVGYSTRSAPEKDLVQERLRAMMGRVLADLDLRIDQTHHQSTGDGLDVFLPVAVELHRALPATIQAWERHLVTDNERYTHRMRLRVSFAVGPVWPAAIGLSGSTIVEVARLLDAQPLRQAIIDHPDADVAALVSDQLHQYVIGEGHVGLDPHLFTRVDVKQKEYHRPAWLWVAGESCDR